MLSCAEAAVDTLQRAEPAFRICEAFFAEPAPTHIVDGELKARFFALDQDLREFRFSSTRCYTVRQQARSIPARDVGAYFDAILAPVFRAAEIALSQEAMCRMEAAGELSIARESKRLDLVLRLLRAEPDEIAEYDGSADYHPTMALSDREKGQVRLVGANLLADNLGWIERHAGLRAWLAERAQMRRPDREGRAGTEAQSALQPAFDRLISFHASAHPGASLEIGRTILSTWIEEARNAIAGPPATSLFAARATLERLYTLGEMARHFGLRNDVRTLYDDITDGRLPRLAWAIRAAAVASFMLDDQAPP